MSAKLPNLNEPRIGKTVANPSGIGVFFAVVRTAIANNKWAREDFDQVQLVEGQINKLEKYFNQLLDGEPNPEVDLPAPQAKDIVAEISTLDKSDELENAPEEDVKKKDKLSPEEIIKQNETRKVSMPDEILQRAKDMAETQKIRDAMPAPPVTEAPMPETDQEYDRIF